MVPWAWWLERRILRAGRPLATIERDYALRLGVREPDKIRILLVESIPLPVPRAVVKLLRPYIRGIVHPAGMCLGHGVFLERVFAEQEGIIGHELVHVLQHERQHGHIGFLWRYLYECLLYGYGSAPLEIEARWPTLRDAP